MTASPASTARPGWRRSCSTVGSLSTTASAHRRGLIEMLGFDYFTLLDRLTIARSRRHLEKYYGTLETGRFPERLKPINVKPDVDLAGEFRSIRRSTSRSGV